MWAYQIARVGGLIAVTCLPLYSSNATVIDVDTTARLINGLSSGVLNGAEFYSDIGPMGEARFLFKGDLNANGDTFSLSGTRMASFIVGNNANLIGTSFDLSANRRNAVAGGGEGGLGGDGGLGGAGGNGGDGGQGGLGGSGGEDGFGCPVFGCNDGKPGGSGGNGDQGNDGAPGARGGDGAAGQDGLYNDQAGGGVQGKAAPPIANGRSGQKVVGTGGTAGSAGAGSIVSGDDGGQAAPAAAVVVVVAAAVFLAHPAVTVAVAPMLRLVSN